jgi:putative transposase
MPQRKKGTANQIISELWEAEASWGKTVAEAFKKIGMTEQRYYRWKKKFRGLRIDQAKRLRKREKEYS